MSKNKQQSSSNKYQSYFETAHLKTDLKERSVKGGALVFVTQALIFVSKFGSTPILARLLTPEDYGLIGMATVLTGFVEYFGTLGLSTATIQRTKINHEQVSTLFWINVGVSCLVALAIALLAPLVAAFYHEPRLRGVTLALSFSFIFGGLTVQHQALLRRQMKFDRLAKIEIISTTIGVLVAIAAAYSGLSYWALILMTIVTVMCNAVGVWLACSWRPGLPVRNAGVRSLLAYGGNITGFGIVNYFSRNLDNVLIGRRWGSQELGLYAQAYKLVLLPIQQINNPITSVALPTLSSLQTEPEKFCNFYYKAMLAISILGMPMIGFIYADADRLILLALGEQWLDTIPIFKFLVPAAFNAIVGVGLGWAYQSLGTVDRLFRWGVFYSVVNATIFVLSVPYGAIGVAAAYGLSSPFFLVAGYAYCYHKTPLKLSKLAAVLYPPAIASFGAAAIFIYFNSWLHLNVNPIANILIDLALYSTFNLLLWLLIPNGKNTLQEMLQLLKVLKNK